jgi:cell division protein FtsQ
VDLRYERQVVLEMAPGAGAAQSTPDDQAAPDTENGKTQAEEPAKAAKLRPSPAKPAVKGKNLKADARRSEPAGKAASKTKTAAAKAKAAKEKKRAEARRAALNMSKHKPAHPTRPAAAEGQ